MAGKNLLLSELKDGQCGVVAKIFLQGSLRRRLFELGLIPGTNVQAVIGKPRRTPRGYFVRGSVFALRQEDAESILLK